MSIKVISHPACPAKTPKRTPDFKRQAGTSGRDYAIADLVCEGCGTVISVIEDAGVEPLKGETP